jgi:chromate transport protein ChrA
MQSLRKVISWCFAVESLLVLVFLWRGPFTAYRQRGSIPVGGALLASFFLIVIAIIFAAAWWIVWKERPSANRWGIAASLSYLLIFLQPHVFPSQLFPRRNVMGHMGALFLGIAGLLIFFRREEIKADSEAPDPENVRN